jgi:hypothetical protein
MGLHGQSLQCACGWVTHMGAGDVREHGQCAGTWGMCQWGHMGDVIIIKYLLAENYRKQKKTDLVGSRDFPSCSSPALAVRMGLVCAARVGLLR